MSKNNLMKLFIIICVIFSPTIMKEPLTQTNRSEPIRSTPELASSSPEINVSKQINWNSTFGKKSGEDIGRSMVRCQSGGGYLITGWTNSSGAGDYDAFLMKVNDDGTQLWNYTYGGTDEDYGYQVIECAGGGIALFGDTKSFGPGGREMWLVRLDVDGNHLWNRTYGNVSSEDLGRSFTECKLGGFALCGVTTHLSSDVLLVRTNPGGFHLWNKTYGGVAVDRCFQSHSIVELAGGGFCIVGYSISYGVGESDVYLIRTDASGNMLWNRTYGGLYLDRPQALIECSNGGFLITANSNSYADGGAWIIRTDPFGNVLWNCTYNNTEIGGAKYALETANKSFVIAGGSSGEGAGQGDGAMILVDPDGEYVWGCTYGTATGDGVYSLVDLGNYTFTWAGYTHNWGTNDLDVWMVNLQVNLIPIEGTPSDSWKIIVIVAGIAVSIIAASIFLVLMRKKKRETNK